MKEESAPAQPARVRNSAVKMQRSGASLFQKGKHAVDKPSDQKILILPNLDFLSLLCDNRQSCFPTFLRKQFNFFRIIQTECEIKQELIVVLMSDQKIRSEQDSSFINSLPIACCRALPNEETLNRLTNIFRTRSLD